MTNIPSSPERRSSPAFVLGALLLLAPAFAPEVFADPTAIEKFGWTVNGQVGAATQIDNVLYVGGRFTRVSPFDALLGSFFGLSAVTGEPSGGLPLVDGQVFAIEPDGAGGYYIGGDFTTVAGQSRQGLTRIRADGSLDPDFLPALERHPSLPGVSVSSLVRDGNRLFFAGSFVSVGGAPRALLAAVDAASGAVAPWIPARTGQKLAVTAGRLIVAGATTQTVTGMGVVALDIVSGALIWEHTLSLEGIPTPSGFNSIVNDVIAVGSRVIVGGRFGSNGPPQSCRGTLVWLDVTTGNVDPTWVPSSSDCGAVGPLAVSGETLYVGGSFTRIGGQARTNAAAIDLATGAVTAWSPQPNGAVQTLAVSSIGSVYLGGQFTAVLGQPRAGFAEVDASQNLTPWTTTVHPSFVNQIVTTEGGVVIVGSSPAILGGIVRQNLAAFDLSTGALLDWQPSANAPVGTMANVNGTVFIGGAFTSISGTTRGNLAAIDATSGAVLPWNPSPAGLSPLALIAHEGYIYVSLSPPARLARIDSVTGVVDDSWAPVIDFPFAPSALLAHEGRLYVAGFPNLTNQVGLVAIDLPSGQRLPWGPRVTGGSINVLARADMTLFVGGTFTSLDGQARANLGAFDLRTGLLTPWSPTTNGTVTELAIADRVVVTGGRFTTLSGQPRNGLGAVTFSGAPGPWNPDHGGPAKLIVGAAEVTAVGTAAPFAFLTDISTFALEGAPRPSNLRATVTDAMVSLTWTPPVGVRPLGYRIEAGSRSGRSDLGTLVLGGATTSLSTGLPNGTYFVRVRALLSADEPATDPSNELVLNVGCTAPPAMPTGLFAQLDGAHVTLRWTASSPTAEHVLEVGSTVGAADLATIPIPAGRETFDADAPDRQYFARVRAVNGCGASGPSAEIMFTVGASVPLPGPPTGLSGGVNGGTVTLSWTAPPGPIIGYVIEAGSASGLANLATIALESTSSFQVPGVPPGTYFIRVRAITAAGVGPPSSDIIVTL